MIFFIVTYLDNKIQKNLWLVIKFYSLFYLWELNRIPIGFLKRDVLEN